ncbi:MAG: hypothetical protein D6684_00005, partial [Deinococcus-Thermus bacterium]
MRRHGGHSPALRPGGWEPVGSGGAGFPCCRATGGGSGRWTREGGAGDGPGDGDGPGPSGVRPGGVGAEAE